MLLVSERLALGWRGWFPYDIRQLGFGNQVLCLGADKLLLKDHESRTLGLLHLELGNLVGNLILAIAARLHALLRVANVLQNTPGVVQRVSILLLLLAKLAQDDANLVRNVRDGGVVGLLAPLGQLGGDGGALAAGGLVGVDEVVLALDDLVELARELGLDVSAEGVEGEASALGGAVVLGAVAAVVGSDGE